MTAHSRAALARRIVQAGYNAMGDAYLTTRDQDGPDVALLRDLAARLPGGARVLDAGCGPGAPVLRFLSARYRTVGVDFSETQLALARRSAPGAWLVCQDMTTLAFPDATFDAVVSYFAIIHIPREAHPALLRNFHRMLKPGGYALLSAGRTAWVGTEPDFCGVRMWWSHYDGATFVAFMRASGFEIVWTRMEADSLGDDAAGEHLFILARSAGG
ncbi:MAG: class I SAM-dependent methyltransferase [Anaerolineae bacterium]|nr:class I SAM-dependent methyltransferase [Anaerolineae bacterium]